MPTDLNEAPSLTDSKASKAPTTTPPVADARRGAAIPSTGIERLFEEVERVFRGKRETVEFALTALFAGGHLLLEDIPGTGKTTLGMTLSRALALSFKRIQFTSDLLPSDITGVNVLDEIAGGGRDFVFKPGPVFTNILLADEINRSTPRTQSSLLEAMNEARVTVDNQTHELPRPFMVIATQNPLELHGTYALPESQLDRFLLRLEIGYPDDATERQVYRDFAFTPAYDSVEPVLNGPEVEALQARVDDITLSDALLDYIHRLVRATRESDRFVYGLSTRAGIHLYRASKALAMVRRRNYVIPDDVRDLFAPLASHRLVPRGAHSEGRDSRAQLAELLTRIPVPI
jgi:MoxR-like ATPase